jgi:hypothetical protein
MRLFVLIVILISCFEANAQVLLKTDSTKTDSSKTNVSVKVINPNGKGIVKYHGRAIQTDSVQQALKTGISQFARGEFSVFYEYRLSRHYSFELGAGVTYIDVPYELFVNDGDFLFEGLDATRSRFLSGYAGHAEIRYYPARYETAITGWYLAPAYSYRSWQMEYYVPLGFISETHRMKRIWNDFRLQVGYQNADPYETFFWEWYVAAGVRNVNEDMVTSRPNNEYEFWKIQQTQFSLGGGVKLGIVF